MCYAADATNNMGLGMDTGTAANVLVDTICGSPVGVAFGAHAMAVGTYENFDHIIIPGGQCNTPRPAAGLGVASVDRYCGLTFNCVQTLGTEANGYIKNQATDIGTICTSTKPFQVCIKTDGVEGAIGAASEVLTTTTAGDQTTAAITQAGTRGFRMNYWQSSTCLLRN